MIAEAHGTSGKEPLPSLALFSGAPAILQRVHDRGLPPGLLLLLPVLVVPLLVLGALAKGSLTANGLPSVLCHDWAKLALLNHQATCVNTASQTSDFPLLRDVPVLTVAIILSTTPYIVYRQWAALSAFLPSLSKYRCISFESDGHKDEYFREVSSANEYYVHAGGLGAVYAAVAFVSVALVSIACAQHGIYERLAPNGLGVEARQQWARNAYSSWWANFNNNWPGWLGYLLVGSLGIYSIVLQDVMGWRAVYFMWRTRRLATYYVDEANPDGSYGWREGRRVILFTYVSVVVHGIGLALIAISLPLSAAVIFMGPLLLCWAFTVPLCIGIPCYVVRRSIRQTKARRLEHISAQLRRLDEDPNLDDDARAMHKDPYMRQCAAIQQISDLPIRQRSDWPIVGITLLASMLSIYAALALIYGSP